MKRLSILMLLLLISLGIGFAQEAEAAIPDTENSAISQEDSSDMPPPEATEEQPEQETEENESILSDDLYLEDEQFVYKMNQQGDQFIKIGLMVDIPLHPATRQLKVGGSGTLGYMRFLNSNLAVGGDASFSYMTTVGKNVFTSIPLMTKSGTSSMRLPFMYFWKSLSELFSISYRW